MQWLDVHTAIPWVPTLGESNNFCKHESVELGYPRKHEGNTLMKYFREGKMCSEDIKKVSFLCQLEDCIESYSEVAEPNYKLMITAHEGWENAPTQCCKEGAGI